MYSTNIVYHIYIHSKRFMEKLLTMSSVTYLQKNTAKVIKFTRAFFTNFDFLLLQEWEYQYEILLKKQLQQN